MQPTSSVVISLPGGDGPANLGVHGELDYVLLIEGVADADLDGIVVRQIDFLAIKKDEMKQKEEKKMKKNRKNKKNKKKQVGATARVSRLGIG